MALTPGWSGLTRFVRLRRRGSRRLSVAAAAMMLLATQPARTANPQAWTASWSSAQQSACAPAEKPRSEIAGATLREVVHLSLGGDAIRLRLSNQYGKEPLVLNAVAVAAPRAAGVTPGGDEAPVLFARRRSVTIAPGGDVVSDPLLFAAQPLSSLAVSIVAGSVPACLTAHPGARATSFLMPGNHIGEITPASAETFVHWYFLSSVEVTGPAKGAVAVIGDSITDGRDSTTDGNHRWTDVLAQRLAPLGVGVLNFGIGGNQILGGGLGPNAASRFDRDALGARGVHWVVILEGVNDLGVLDRLHEHSQAEHDALVHDLEAALQRMAHKAHAAGMCVYGATVMPDGGSGYYHPGERSEADRVALNRWIRTSNTFDGVIDFDRQMADPLQPDHLSPDARSADGLHPGPAGYKRMGDAVPLELFEKECKK